MAWRAAISRNDLPEERPGWGEGGWASGEIIIRFLPPKPDALAESALKLGLRAETFWALLPCPPALLPSSADPRAIPATEPNQKTSGEGNRPPPAARSSSAGTPSVSELGRGPSANCFITDFTFLFPFGTE